MQNGNGLQTKPFATKLIPLTKPRPISWSSALELCRKAMGWTQKQMIAEALPAENVGVNDVKRWELAKDLPTLNQCNKLRAAMPDLRNYEDLLRFDRRETKKPDKATPKEALQPEGWPGPPVKCFADALRWARIKHGMSQKDLALTVGVGQIAPWEKPDRVMIKGAYEHLCEILPELRFAPPPPFSSKYQNQVRSKGYLVAEEHRQEASRAARTIAEEAPAPAPKAAPGPDHAPLNTAGAQYGVLAAEVIGLEAEMEKMKRRHSTEQIEMDERIAKATKRRDEARAQLTLAAQTMHTGGRP